MLFSGNTFFLSTKLSLPDTRTLSEHIRNGGGVLAPNNLDVNTITVLDTWEPKSLLVEMTKGHKLLYAGQAIIRYCVANGVPLPVHQLPLLCNALARQVVSFSGMSSDIQPTFAKIVEWCGGAVQDRLSSSTTILVVGDVHPSDLEAARARSIPCVSYEWLERVFQTKNWVELDLCAVPPLRGSVIALSGFSSRHAFTELKSIAQSLGSHFIMEVPTQDDNQKGPKQTHLVVEPKTVKRGPKSKYDFCKRKGIFVVSKDWLLECQKFKRWLPEHDFEVSHPDDPKCHVQRTANVSTPATTSAAVASSSSVPSVSAMKTETSPKGDAHPISHSPVNSKKRPHTEVQDLMEGIDWQVEMEAYQPPQTKKAAPAIQSENAAPAPGYASSSASVSAHTIPEKSSSAGPAARSNLNSAASTNDANMAVDVASANTTTTINNTNGNIHGKAMDVAAPSATTDSNKFFSGLCIVAVACPSSSLREFIEPRGGIYCESPEHYGLLKAEEKAQRQLYVLALHGVYASPHHAIFESFLAQFRSPPPVVTAQWLECCERAGQLLPVSMFPMLFTPLPFPKSHYEPTMSSVVLCTASISEPECSWLLALTTWLGANRRSCFVPSKTTHLITQSMDGKKQQVALQHGIPLVTPEWLYCCAKAGCRVEEHAFRVRPTAVSNHPMLPSITSIPNPNPIITASTSHLLPSSQSGAVGASIPRPNSAGSNESAEYVDVYAKPTFARETSTGFGSQPQMQQFPIFPNHPNNQNMLHHFHQQQGPLNPLNHFPSPSPKWASNGAPNGIPNGFAYPNHSVDGNGNWNGNGPNQWNFPVPFEKLLSGVVIYFSKLSRSDSDALSEIAVSMGAKTSWAYELIVTHVVTIGKAELPIPSSNKVAGKGFNARDRNAINPLNDHKPHFVSPQWLRQCSATGQRVPEALFPSSLDPRSALGISMDPSASSSSSSSSMAHHPRYWSLNIVHEGSSLTSSQSSAAALGKYSSSTSSGYSSSSHTKRGMTSVVVPKTKVQSDFDEFDSLDSLYSTHRPPPAPSVPASQNMHVAPITTPIAAPMEVPQAIAPQASAPLPSVPVLPTVQAPTPQPLPLATVQDYPISPTAEHMAVDQNLPVSAPLVTHDLVEPAKSDIHMQVDQVEQASSVAKVHSEAETASQLQAPFLAPATTSFVAAEIAEPNRVEMVANILDVGANQGSYPIDSQDLPASSQQSQVVDPQMVEDMKAQTDMMRKLMASIPMLRMPSKPVSNTDTVGTEEFGTFGAPAPLEPSLSRHIARSALLDIVRGEEPGSREESGHSSGNESPDLSVVPSELGIASDGLSASQSAAEYLHGAEFEAIRAPKVSYATLEPSEAVKSKMLGKAQNHIDSLSFQESAAAEIRQLELIMSTPSVQQQQQQTQKNSAASSEPPVRHPSNNSIKSTSSITSESTTSSSVKATYAPVVNEVMDVDLIEIPAKSTSVVPHTSSKVPKPLFAAEDEVDDILAQLDADNCVPSAAVNDEALLSTGTSRASNNLFGKAKRKSTSTSTTVASSTSSALPSSPPRKATAGATSSSVTSKVVASSKPATATRAKAPAVDLEMLLEEAQVGTFKDAPWPKNTSVSVYLSGFDSKELKKEYEQKLKHMGIQVCSRDGIWTHLIINTLKVTDRTIVSLAKGLWLVDLKWIDESLKAGKLLPEASFEFRSSRQARNTPLQFDPRACRQTVAKTGRGFFEGMKILFLSHQMLWTSVLKDSGAKVDIYKEDPARPMTYSIIMQYDLVFTSTAEWATLSPTTQSILNKSHVVVCEYFVEYLKDVKEPNVADFHPQRRETKG